MSTPTPHTSTSQGRGALIGLAAMFFLPLAAAFWLYYAGGWRPAGSTNHGELISPARALGTPALQPLTGQTLDADILRGRWTLVYIGDGACASECRQTLWLMRQTRLLLAEDRDRVQRVFITEDNCCDRPFLESEHAGLLTLRAEDDAARQWLGAFPRESGVPFIYVIDPLGNLMMRFDAREDPKGLLRDLEKLLKLSHIG